MAQAVGVRVLTDAEREMLLQNTAALIAQFEAERLKEQEYEKARLAALRKLQVQRLTAVNRQPIY